MLPRWHILLGAIFSLLIWIIFPYISLFYVLMMFLSSFLIDFDHYLNAVRITKKFGFFSALKFYERLQKKEEKEKEFGIKKKGIFQPFHTIEFHIFVLALGLIHEVFVYVFLGMVFHSILDFAYLAYKDKLYKREYFLIRWLIEKL
ncbi:MAG: hypothetical protein N3D20_03020 [Candidatus Pacearchaeota archaeon]|nr:hypothetical protein [Candidatus Pacearchaeota archaeon]